MKQTAVEWLFEQMKNHINIIQDKEFYKIIMSIDSIEKIIEQAKKMEKKQIAIAFGEGIFSVNKNGVQYYNETFKSE